MPFIFDNCSYSLKHGLEYVTDEVAAATIIQRAFRKWMFTNSVSKGITQEQLTQLHLQMKEWSEQGFSRYPRIPLTSRLITHEKCEELRRMGFSDTLIIRPAVIDHVTFDTFKRRLGEVLDEFLQHIMSLPEGERGYVLVVDEREKSNSWALSLCMDRLAAHPPINVITKDSMSKVYDNPNVKHIAFIDDASYSGSQLKSAMDQCSLYFPMMSHLKGVHVLVPFLSPLARGSILDMLRREESIEGKIFFPRSSPMRPICDLPAATKGMIKASDISDFAHQIAVRYQGSNIHLSEDRVPMLHLFAFDHKIPDALSVVTPLMESLVGKVVPPYKAEFDVVLDEHARSLEPGLRVDLLPEIGPQLSESVVLVRKEGMLYLVTKTYLENEVEVKRSGRALEVLSAEMIPILPHDLVEVKGIGEFLFDGHTIALSE